MRRSAWSGAFFARFATGLLVFAHAAHAADIYWNGTGTSWVPTASWSTDPNAATPNPGASPTTGDNAIFSISTVNSPQAVGLGASWTVNSVVFQGSNTSTTTIDAGGGSNRNLTLGAGGITMNSGAGEVTIGGGPGGLTNVLFGANQSWRNNSANDLNFVSTMILGRTSGGLPHTTLSITGTGAGSIVMESGLQISQSSAASGYVKQSSGSVTVNSLATTANTFAIGGGAGSYGYYGLSGGNLNVTGPGQFRIATSGNANAAGVMYVSGGVLTTSNSAGFLLLGSQSSDSGQQGQAVLYVTGGTVASGQAIDVANRSGKAQLTVDGAGFVNSGTNNVVVAGGSAAGDGVVGVVNLNGGVLQAGGLVGTSVSGTKSSFVNFDGGTLRATMNNASFLQGHTAANINQGGAVIDSNGHSITIAQNLLAPTGNGVSTISITGTGYSGAPAVLITGDGTGATAVANVDDSGNLTGITVTNAGVGYSTASITLTGGGGAVTSGTTVNLAANVGGGLTKTGSGTLTLTGNNTYNGGSVVSAGTLLITSTTGAGTGGVSISAGTLKVDVNSGAGSIANAVTMTGPGGTYVLERANGSSLAVFAASSDILGGSDTGASILQGTAGAARTVTTSFSTVSAASNDQLRSSDVFSLAGTGTDIFVLQLQIADVAAGQYLGWLNGSNIWVNAVSGNIGVAGIDAVTNFAGSFASSGASATSNYLGSWGYDTSANTVWAVLDHNSEFAVIPEPSTYLLLGVGLTALCLRRRMRRCRA